MTGFGLLLIAGFSSAKYLLVEIGDGVGTLEGTINEFGLDLSDKDPKGISHPFRIIKMTLVIIPTSTKHC